VAAAYLGATHAKADAVQETHVKETHA
jgi:hypothetical protein